MTLSSTRSAHRALTPVTIAASLLLGLTAATGVSLPAQAATSPLVASEPSNSSPTAFGEIAADADLALRDARDAVRVANEATAALTASGLTVEGPVTIDTRELRGLISQLAAVELTPTLLVPEITDDTAAATSAVREKATDLQSRMTAAAEAKAAAEAAAAAAAAEAQRAAEAAAAQAAAEAAAAAAAAEAAQSSSSSGGSRPSGASISVSPGSAQAIARDMLAGYGWGDDQFSCLVSLWDRESGWNVSAHNSSSGAYGIPQSLPGSKMASAGADWETNPATQISWGLGYISGRYGSPCGAWSHSESAGWY